MSGSWDTTIRLWDPTTGHLQKTLAGHSGWVTAVAFSPEGNHIVSGSNDKTIKLWDAVTGDFQNTLAWCSNAIAALAVSPDGKYIASRVFHDKVIRIWDLARCIKTSRLLGATLGHVLNSLLSKKIISLASEKTKDLDRVDTLKFSADGRSLTTNDGLIKLESFFENRESIALNPVEDLWVGNQWIHYGASPVLRLPFDFMPNCFDVQGDHIAIGFKNGLVLSFGIDREHLERVFRNQ